MSVEKSKDDYNDNNLNKTSYFTSIAISSILISTFMIILPTFDLLFVFSGNPPEDIIKTTFFWSYYKSTYSYISSFGYITLYYFLSFIIFGVSYGYLVKIPFLTEESTYKPKIILNKIIILCIVGLSIPVIFSALTMYAKSLLKMIVFVFIQLILFIESVFFSKVIYEQSGRSNQLKSLIGYGVLLLFSFLILNIFDLLVSLLFLDLHP